MAAAALSSLLPTLNSNIPPPLLTLTSSLLAQSHHHLPLKPTDEIARPYLCAELACRRLASRLRLPPLHSRPPCAPRVYSRLLEQAEASLPAGGGATPRKRKLDDASSPAAKKKKDNNNAGPSTPSKNRNPPVVSTPTSAPLGKKVAFGGSIAAPALPLDAEAQEAPEWVMPLIRRLCMTFSTPQLPPHVYTGTCVVLKLAQLWPLPSGSNGADDPGFRKSASTLILAIFFMVLTRMQRGPMTKECYEEMCKRAVEAVGGGGGGVRKEQVDRWVKKMNVEGWCRGREWFEEGVPEGLVEVGGEGGDGEEEERAEEADGVAGTRRQRTRRVVRMEEVEEEDDPEGVLLPGLGTMMQDAVDFLSEERRLEYLDWKAGVMKRIKQMDKGKGKAVAVA